MLHPQPIVKYIIILKTNCGISFLITLCVHTGSNQSLCSGQTQAAHILRPTTKGLRNTFREYS